MKIRIRQDERVILTGKTGSGKTTLARVWLQAIPRLIVIDSKFNLKPDVWQGEVIDQLPGELPENFRYIVRSDDPMTLGESLIKFRDYFLYVDELFAVFPSALKSTPAWRGVWTRGREFNIAVWAGVQRPANIPLVTLSEADHYFCFRLNMREDRQRMTELIGVDVPMLPRYSFIYAYPIDEVYLRFGKLEL